MKRGLVIGKFMPIHHGHMALIKFAAEKCDELIVSMSYTDADPIDGDLRFFWIKEIFKDQHTIHVHKIKDDFDDDTLPLEQRTKLWAARMREVYPPIHHLNCMASHLLKIYMQTIYSLTLSEKMLAFQQHSSGKDHVSIGISFLK